MSDSRQTRRALVTGAGGLLGGRLTAHLRGANWQVIACARQELDIANEDEVRRRVEESRPEVVINCAAITDVDLCEREPERAKAVNEDAPRYLARACRGVGAGLLHVSTDYVFDGEKEGLYTQEDAPNPLSVYAKTKLGGEDAVRQELNEHYIVRTSWVFGRGGKNFGSRIIDLAKAGAKIKGVNDQTSIATYAVDLAARLEEIIEKGVYGLYQVTNTGVMTWYDFGRYALELAGMGDYDFEPVSRTQLNQLAPRPKNSAMRCLLSENLGLKPLRHWREAVAEFVRDSYR